MNSGSNNLDITRRSVWAVLREHIRVAIYTRLTKPALPLFLRGGDVISAGPMAVGWHEPQVSATLKRFAIEGYNDFLLDIGANIGLTTSVVGESFDSVILFEPNPLCHGILATNLAISLINTPYEIRRYGLGRTDSKVNLRLPRSNWGGAYIVSDDNAYSRQTLLAKDGFTKDDLQDHLSLEIDIRNATEVFKTLFSEYQANKKLSGSVKIDIEGFEIVVIQAIAATLPLGMRLSIIFEFLGGNIAGEEILSLFQGRADFYAVIKEPNVSGSRYRKLFALLTKGFELYSLKPWTPGLIANDFVLRIKSTGENS